MTVEQAIEIIRESLLTALFIMTPILFVGLVVGLVVSIFQAVTQIQEQTLTFVPKIIAMAMTLMVIVPWIGMRLIEFTMRMFEM